MAKSFSEPIHVYIERAVHALTNAERSKQGHNGLSYDDHLASIARGHSTDMANRGYFSHQNPQGRSPTDRAALTGYRCTKQIGRVVYTGVAENIFMTNTFKSKRFVWKEIITGNVRQIKDRSVVVDTMSDNEIAQSAVSNWMKSPGHRANILNRVHEREGIGVHILGEKAYVTQLFF